MDRNSSVKMIKKLNVTDLSGEKVMVDFDEGKYFLIKGVGNDIWDMISDKTEAVNIDSIVEGLLKEYDVTEDVCVNEVISFLTSLEKIGIVAVI